MKNSVLLIGVVSMAVAGAWLGCSSDDSNSSTASGGDGGNAAGSGGSGGKSGSSTSSSSSSTTSSSSGAGGNGGNGTGGAGGDGGGASACDAPVIAPSNGSCVALSATIVCNPVTNEGCTGGSGCDGTEDGGFACFSEAEGSIGALCEPCDPDATQFCKGTFTCDGAQCIRYCCNDNDCGSATCVKAAGGGPLFENAPDVGVCLTP